MGPRGMAGAAFACAALFASACNSPAHGGATAVDAAPLGAKVNDPVAAPTDVTPVTPSDDERRALADANAGLAADILAKTSDKHAPEANLAFSPLSIAAVLGMLVGGARGETSAEIAKVLHLGASPARAADVAGGVVADIVRRQPDTHIANGLFGDSVYAFDREYQAKTQAAFGSPLVPLDFRARPDDARASINTWVAARTGQRIHDLLPAGSVGASTRLVVANAIDFSARWATPFEKSATHPAAFHPPGAAPISVPMMHADLDAPFAALDGAKVLDLRFDGGATAMTFVLPDRPDGLRALEAKLDGPTFVRWVGALAPQPVACAIPEFDIAPAEPMPLTTMLEGLGMRLAFDRDHADFSGIAPAPDPGQRLYLGAVLHAAAVTVDEAGTRATAATAVSAPSGAPVVGEKRRPFVADHPFAFFIRDVASGAVLFAGRVVRPGEP